MSQRDLDAVRRQPAKYIGDTGSRGLHRLVWEVIDNFVDEALAGWVGRIDLRLHKDGSLSVRDNGRGAPVDMLETGVPAIEFILTTLPRNLDQNGQRGVCMFVVNALSEAFEVEVYRDGKHYRQTYSRGNKTTDLRVIGRADDTGTMIRFKADASIMETTEFSFQVIQEHLRALAWPTGANALRITLHDERTDKSEEHHFPHGPRDSSDGLDQAGIGIRERGSEPRCVVDPSTGRPILMAELRQQRPIYTAPGAVDRPCPFCPGQEAQTPPEVAAVRTSGKADAPGWTVRAFANKYPAAAHHEVIAEGSVHREQPAELAASFWKSALGIWQQRIRDLEARPGVRCAFLFKNVGGLAGASIAHNHTQVIGLSELPPRLQLEIAQTKLLGYCPVCATLQGAASRLVSEGPQHVALCPDPPKLPFETWLVPRDCQDDFLHTDLDSLAQVLHDLFTAVQRGLGSPPFNIWLHRAPGVRFHWHLELQPRTGHLAGLELGGDMYINSMPATDAAARLRAGLLDDPSPRKR